MALLITRVVWKRGLFKVVHFLETLENPDSRDWEIPKTPQSVQTKENPNIF